MDTEKQARGSMSILFLVVLIDMIGFTLVIPFLTYFIQDLAQGDGFTDIGTRDRWVGIVLAIHVQRRDRRCGFRRMCRRTHTWLSWSLAGWLTRE